MEIPYEFEQFVKGFYPGSAKDKTDEEWIASVLEFHSESSKNVIRAFLDVLLSQRHTDEEIEEAWRRQYPSYEFSKGGHRYFLSKARAVLE